MYYVYDSNLGIFRKVYNSQVNDVKLLYYCLHSLNNLHPISLIPKNVTDDIVSKLSVVENYKIGNVLGKYFLKIKVCCDILYVIIYCLPGTYTK